jgi:Tfp pilus assembly protein PilO
MEKYITFDNVLIAILVIVLILLLGWVFGTSKKDLENFETKTTRYCHDFKETVELMESDEAAKLVGEIFKN